MTREQLSTSENADTYLDHPQSRGSQMVHGLAKKVSMGIKALPFLAAAFATTPALGDDTKVEIRRDTFELETSARKGTATISYPKGHELAGEILESFSIIGPEENQAISNTFGNHKKINRGDSGGYMDCRMKKDHFRYIKKDGKIMEGIITGYTEKMTEVLIFNKNYSTRIPASLLYKKEDKDELIRTYAF